MPAAWRIVKRRHAARAFDGEGARLHGGRWNSPGRAAVYASENRALAALEVLAGARARALMEAYVLIGVEFDEGLVTSATTANLEDGWRAYPPTPASQAVGDRWLAEGASAVLRVPSALIPAEFNFLLNPRHGDFPLIRIGEAEPFELDMRLVG